MAYGMAYRGIHSDSKSVVIRRADRSASPYVDSVTMDIAGYPGSYPVRVDDRGRVIPVEYVLSADGPEDMRVKAEALADWLRPVIDEDNRPEPVELIFDDAPDRRWMAYPVGQISLAEVIKFGKGRIEFFCPTPYAEALTEQITGLADTNLGTEPVPPLITVTVTSAGGINDLKLGLGSSSKFIYLEGVFAQNTAIVFDKKKRLVTVDSVDAREDLHYTTRWFDLPPGPFTINTTPAGGGNIAVSVKFRERWR